MKSRVLAYAGVALGVFALAWSVAVPMASATQGSSGTSTTLDVTCDSTAHQITVNYTYEGVAPHVASTIVAIVNNTGEQVFSANPGKTGGLLFDVSSPTGQQFDFGGIGVELMEKSGKVVKGSLALWNGAQEVIC